MSWSASSSIVKTGPVTEFTPLAFAGNNDGDVMVFIRYAVTVTCPDDPEAMLRHTWACRDCAVPFAADPSQQIARMDGTDLRRLVDGTCSPTSTSEPC